MGDQRWLVRLKHPDLNKESSGFTNDDGSEATWVEPIPHWIRQLKLLLPTVLGVAIYVWSLIIATHERNAELQLWISLIGVVPICIGMFIGHRLYRLTTVRRYSAKDEKLTSAALKAKVFFESQKPKSVPPNQSAMLISIFLKKELFDPAGEFISNVIETSLKILGFGVIAIVIVLLIIVIIMIFSASPPMGLGGSIILAAIIIASSNGRR